MRLKLKPRQTNCGQAGCAPKDQQGSGVDEGLPEMREVWLTEGASALWAYRRKGKEIGAVPAAR
jgi:hypothetical protein